MTFIYEALEKCRKEGHSAILVTVTEKTGSGPVDIGKKMLFLDSGECFGTVGGGSLELYAKNRCLDLLNKRESITEKYILSDEEVVNEDENAIHLNMACGGKVTLFYEFIGYRQTIYIFGAGHCAKALTSILKSIGLFVVVIDYREDILKENKEADLLVLSHFKDFVLEGKIRPHSMVVVATPSHTYDFEVLDSIIANKIELDYFGMLCSTNKISEYLSSLYSRYGRDIKLNNFYAPIGLDIGTSSPQDIAVSIAGEILAILSHKNEVTHMRDRLIGKLEYWK